MGLINGVLAKSRGAYKDPSAILNWPATIPDGSPWMSFELLTVNGTGLRDSASEEQLIRLSRFEAIHFFSYLLGGEKDLIRGVIQHMHSDELTDYSELLHYFIAEENAHMYQFWKFCSTYGGKVYRMQKASLERSVDRQVSSFIDFSKILIVEEICDYFHVRMSRDSQLPGIVRDISRYHHSEESRHLGMGKEIVSLLWENLRKRCEKESLAFAESTLAKFRKAALSGLYNAEVYRDADFDQPYSMRESLWSHPGRDKIHREMIRRLEIFFLGLGIDLFSDPFNVQLRR